MRSVIAFAVIIATPAHAEWRAANPQVAEAAREPHIAAALAARAALDTALVTGDGPGFASAFAPDAAVNNPFNRIARPVDAAANQASGALTYKYLRRSIEYAVRRRPDEVVLMGEETYEPPAPNPHAGKVVRRRFTDLWRLDDGRWRLSLRQATITAVGDVSLALPLPPAR